jgi:hypothetical protein
MATIKRSKREALARKRRVKADQQITTMTLNGWQPVRTSAEPGCADEVGIYHREHGIIARTRGGSVIRYRHRNPPRHHVTIWAELNVYRIFWLFGRLEKEKLL